jgi:hypothetical protein
VSIGSAYLMWKDAKVDKFTNELLFFFYKIKEQNN